MSWQSRFFIGVLLALSAVQIGLAIVFWGSFGGNFWTRIVFQGVGVGLAVAELLVLIVATEMANRGEPEKATALRTLFFSLIFTNWIADIGAIATHMDHDHKDRVSQVERYQATEQQRDAAAARIAELRQDLQMRGLDRPAAALRPELAAAEALLDQAQTAGRGIAAREKRVGELKSALATVQEIDRLAAIRDAAQDRVLTEGVAPDDVHPQFKALGVYLRWIGIHATPENIQLFLALLLATVMRATLAIGLWAATPQAGGSGVDSKAPSLTEAFTKIFGGGNDGGGGKRKAYAADAERPAAQQRPAPTKRGPWTPRIVDGDASQDTSNKPDLASHVRQMKGQGPYAKKMPPLSQSKTASGSRPKSPNHACPLCDQPVKPPVDREAFLAEIDNLDRDFEGPYVQH